MVRVKGTSKGSLDHYDCSWGWERGKDLVVKAGVREGKLQGIYKEAGVNILSLFLSCLLVAKLN